MFTFAGITEEGRLRVLVGLTAPELRRVQENERILVVNPQPGLWWAVLVESRQPSEKPPIDPRSFMKNRYGVTNVRVVTISAEDVGNLLKCEQLVFHCSPDDGSDLIVFVEKTDETLKESFPMFGIHPATVDKMSRSSGRFGMN